ncbi:MAG TPA: YggT family protein [Anaerolineales bacterium]|nr:YggT family protein [Anaerolineales bacterium]
MTERYEEVRIHSHGDEEHRERIVVDRAAQARRIAYQVSSFLWVFFGLIMGLIGLRVFLKMIGANPGNIFARFIYNFTELFLWPFIGLTSSPSADGLVFETSSVIAILVYALMGWVIVKLTWLLLYRP